MFQLLTKVIMATTLLAIDVTSRPKLRGRIPNNIARNLSSRSKLTEVSCCSLLCVVVLMLIIFCEEVLNNRKEARNKEFADRREMNKFVKAAVDDSGDENDERLHEMVIEDESHSTRFRETFNQSLSFRTSLREIGECK
jgi:hypothetical protein